MSIKAMRADLTKIESTHDDSVYIHVRISTDISANLRRLIIRMKCVQSFNLQIDSDTLNLNQLIIKIRESYHYDDAVDEVITALKRWHEIECGWLNCLPHLYITRVTDDKQLQSEPFCPKETSVGVQLGRVIAQKQWAMINENWLLASMTARAEFHLMNQLT